MLSSLLQIFTRQPGRAWRVAAALALLTGVATTSNANIPVDGGAEAVRIKDLGKVSGWRENALVGYGLVTGLSGTGDSARTRATRQSLANMLMRFGLTLSADDMQSHNTAAVMVTASLSPFAKPGDTMDVTVTSIADARSLVGGLLLMAPLQGADAQTYALAQGSVLVGGYKYDVNGNVVQKNHPTTGTVTNGATVEAAVAVKGADVAPSQLSFSLADADFGTAQHVADAISAEFGQNVARARDASSVEINVPSSARANLAKFIAQVEGLRVVPDVRARVVINERTGTVVTGGNARISRVAIAHGDLRISVVTTNDVSQPSIVGTGGRGVQTAAVSNSRITLQESGDSAFVSSPSNTVADLVRGLNQLKISTRDVISILRAMKSAGALHADLVVQ